MPVQLVYVTFPDEETAEELGQRMLEERLAACFTYWQAGTRYWWEGEIEAEEETLALFKTAPEERQALVDAIEDDHPYDVPCVLPLDSEGGTPGYAEWIQAETGP